MSKALILVLFRESISDATAQIAAGIHPIIVICSIKHKIAVNIFPLKRNEIEGNKIANNIMNFIFLSFALFRRIDKPKLNLFRLLNQFLSLLLLNFQLSLLCICLKFPLKINQ